MASTLTAEANAEGEGKVQTTNQLDWAAKAVVVCITRRSQVRILPPLLEDTVDPLREATVFLLAR